MFRWRMNRIWWLNGGGWVVCWSLEWVPMSKAGFGANDTLWDILGSQWPFSMCVWSPGEDQA